jgi:hypothetical protein
METHLFCEIWFGAKLTTSVYDEPANEVIVKASVFIQSVDETLIHLALGILDSFPFSTQQKTLQDLGDKVMNKIVIYELERELNAEQTEFYNKLHAQNYMDGVKFSYKFDDPLSLADIIKASHSLDIISKDTILKYLLKDCGEYSYKLEKCKPVYL